MMKPQRWRPARRRVEAGFVAPLLVVIGACMALALVFRLGSAWWDGERAETQRQSDVAASAYAAIAIDAGEARELHDLIKQSNSPRAKEALKAAMADERLTNGESMNLRSLMKRELDEAERIAALARLKLAAQN